jgi:RNA polymerase sigma factor (sigma-70 family)
MLALVTPGAGIGPAPRSDPLGAVPLGWVTAALSAVDAVAAATGVVDEDRLGLVTELFMTEGRSLVRLARLFVDDLDAAEDIVQESLLRLARRADSIGHSDRAPAYLRSIVLNLARDHNRRGLVSLRHQATAGRELDLDDDPTADVADRLVRDERHLRVLDCVKALPRRQRDCVTLRYLEGASIEGMAATLGLSPNSVKTHLRRGRGNLRQALADSGTETFEG